MTISVIITRIAVSGCSVLYLVTMIVSTGAPRVSVTVV
jgi:hypothetical protein